jgi:lipopolysaccharide transport system ATP-binding protein
MPTAIEFNNVSKQYRLGLVSTRTLSHDLNRWWQMNIRGKEDPYLKVGSANDRSKAADSEYVWALKDIDFKIEQGDVVGIIGKNGAGKSTLLKLLSRVTGPTTGTINVKGRIGALLEVGTGFHSEMTGRENIYMNGAILGMTKQEITKKLDEIVDFSGCERYIDTPVKRYSSGMTVRLGFAVAAYLDPEILVVDEVLAVGDAEFQKKAIGKMKEVSQGDGRTVLFVSHNMASIRNLCKNGLLLDKGQIAFMGDVNETVNRYLEGQLNGTMVDRVGSGEVRFENYKIEKDNIQLGEDLMVSFDIVVVKQFYSPLVCCVDVINLQYEPIAIASILDDEKELGIIEQGKRVHITCRIKNVNILPNKYYLSLYVGTGHQTFDHIKYCMNFIVEQGNQFIHRPTLYNPNFRTVLQSNWEID